MDGAFDDLDATEMAAIEVWQKFIVIARNVDDARSFAGLAQQLLHDIVVSLRPVPS